MGPRNNNELSSRYKEDLNHGRVHACGVYSVEDGCCSFKIVFDEGLYVVFDEDFYVHFMCLFALL